MDELNDVDVETVESESNPLVNLGKSTNIERVEENKIVAVSTAEKNKLVKLPLSRIKYIMKTDPDCGLISQDALLLVTKATELFIEFVASESVKQTISSKRKTVLKRDVDCVFDSVPHLCFLEGALE